LKFIVHSGEFDKQKIGNREELIGPEVVVAHRLLKNSVSPREYALLTSAYLDGQNCGVPASEGADQYEDVGKVDYVVSDLAPVREGVGEKRRFFLTPEDAKLKFVEEIAATAEVVFDALTDFDKARIWQTTIKELVHVSGEHGKAGEIYRCVHDDGSKAAHLTVAVDEGRRWTERVWLSPLVKDCYFTIGVEPLGDDHCRAYFYVTFKPGIPVVSHLALPIVIRMMTRSIRKDLGGLKALCESQAGSASSSAVE
jgi:hypothetical protein